MLMDMEIYPFLFFKLEISKNNTIKNGNIPAADTALKIANILGVSVEFLVTGTEINENLNVSKFYLLYQKYQNIFNMLEAMSLEKQKKIMQIVELCKELDVL